MYDLIIKNGQIVDGSGLPRFKGDVAVNDGVIAAVGRVRGEAARVIDADGRVVMPGIIDPHTHYDAQVFWDPALDASGCHGVTTVVMGNCGYSLAPCKPEDWDLVTAILANVEAISKDVIHAGVDRTWTTYEGFLASLDRPFGVNVATTVGHQAVRLNVMGEDFRRPATDDEIKQMQALVAEARAAGVFGFSTSKSIGHSMVDGSPVPSYYSLAEELYELGCALGPPANFEHTGLIDSTGRGTGYQESHREMLARLSAERGHRVHWVEWVQSPVRPDEWQWFGDWMAKSSDDGGRMYGLLTANSNWGQTKLSNPRGFQFWGESWRPFMALSLEERIAALRDPERRAQLVGEVKAKFDNGMGVAWNRAEITEVQLDANSGLVGRKLAEVAQERGQDPIDAMIDISLGDELGTTIRYPGLNADPEALHSIIRSPFCEIGISDAGAHGGSTGANFGTKFLANFVRDKGVLSLEDGVRKLTFQCASFWGFHDRGLLRPGKAADIAVIDLEELGSTPTIVRNDLPANGSRNVVESTGVSYVIVNGRATIEDGKPTGELPGHLMRDELARSGA